MQTAEKNGDCPYLSRTFLDRLLADISEFDYALLCLLFPVLALLLGTAGIIVSKNTRARERAMGMIVWGGIISVFEVILILGLIAGP